jgi:Transmembrane amino acid transporter protein
LETVFLDVESLVLVHYLPFIVMGETSEKPAVHVRRTQALDESTPSDHQTFGSSSLHHDAKTVNPSSSQFIPLELDSGDNDVADNDEDLVYPLVHQKHSEDWDSPSKSNKLTSVDDHHGAAPPGSATTPQVIINIVISFVGAGLLGIPNAFSQAGWLLGSITLLTVSALNVYAMLCLPSVQVALQRQHPNEMIQSYGDLGRVILGDRGEKIIFGCLGISQAGFATAYLIFIAANLHSIYNVSRGLVCMACIPGLALLVQFRDLKSLSPFSLLANTANFCALSAVLFQDYES